MSIATGLAIYFIIWWMVLFAVLPFGVRASRKGGRFARQRSGAPALRNCGAARLDDVRRRCRLCARYVVYATG